MKKVLMVLMCAAILMAALEAQAATARVRCFIEKGSRVRIKVDGQDLARGTYGARVKNARTGAIVKTEASKVRTVTIAPDDIDLDFDSTAQSNDLDSYVSPTFVKVGDTVRASVVNVKSGVTVAAASTSCVSK